MSLPSDDIAAALQACIEAAPAALQATLATALEQYAARHHRTFTGVERQPFARNLIAAMEEGSAARISRGQG